MNNIYKGSNSNDNQLMHYKYLRREKMSNGKYKYYYQKDNKKIKVKLDRKQEDNYDFNGTKVKSHIIKTGETGNKWESVSESTYNRTKTGVRLYVGRTPLKEITEEQISVGKSFVKDLLSGNLYRK